MKKNYNYTRRKLYLPEYGRHIQEMIDSLQLIEDRRERNRQARAVIAVMGNLNPLLRDTADFTHKLWDHLFIMSDFQLDVDSPYPQPSRQELTITPRRMAYTQGRISYKHYGKYVERMIAGLSEEKDRRTMARTVDNLARYMRTKSYEYNQEHPNNEVIVKDIKRMSGGAIEIDEVALNNLRSDYKQHFTARPQKGPQQRQQQRTVDSVLQVELLVPTVDVQAHAAFVLARQQRQDNQQIHRRADDDGNRRALQVLRREVRNRFLQRGYAEERRAFCPERREQQPRQCAQEGERRRTAQQRKRGCAVHVVRHAVEFCLTGRVLLPENADVQLRHVRDGQSAADEEEHFNRLVAHPRAASRLHFANQLQQPFVQQTLAVVPAAQRRDARNAQRPQQERNVQQRLFAPEAADIIKIQRVQVHVHHARRDEQRQLDERVIQHVHHAAIRRQRAFVAQQHHHRQPPA